MPYLQLQDQQFPLPAGDATVGAFEGATVRLPSGDPGTRAVISVGPKGVVIRRGAPDATILVNGVQLGLEPSPLLHGDRVEIAGHELRLGDDKQEGSTQFVSAADVAAMVAAKSGAAPKKPTTATGGRLVSLVDGREYAVPDSGITFGREVGNDVVLASSEVSRRHASIAPAANGYVLTDHSTNGVWVNGTRISGSQLLGRGDVLKMGTEEFRFYADVAKAAPAPTAAPTPAAPTPAAPTPAAPAAAAPVAAAAAATASAAAPAPAAAPVRSTRAPLATLEIKAEGPLKGTKFELHAALTNIGRGDHNDIAIRDESISDSHAKIQKRADGWWVVDQGSTNGTYVGGRRVQGEQKLEGSPDLRFGGIKMTFRAAVQAEGAGGSTRAIAAVDAEALRKNVAAKPPAKTPAMAKQPKVAAPEPKKSGCGAAIALLVALAGTGVGLVAFLLTTVR
ncbi:MAG: FHA domain-containing protein [Gemmatimonadaceae bacterium]|nr:FHA domain-containing protein [Gemmatimonadaceae bacterium]MCW5825645.1 FHA domain-containing protein [Gemmatimonadaceae bacterium]